MLHPHLPHPHVHPDFEHHPWRMVPAALGAVFVIAVLLTFVVFEIAKLATGQAY